MALDCTLYDVQGVQPALVIIPGRIVGVTSGPSAAVAFGKKYTVSANTSGVYTVTFSNPLGSIISVVATLAATAPADLRGHTIVLEAITTSGFKINVYGDGGGGAPAAHGLIAAEWINFIVVGTNSSLD